MPTISLPKKPGRRIDGASITPAAEHYKVVIDGEEVAVSELDGDQLRNQLCLAIAYLLEIQSRSGVLTDLVGAWRKGHAAPEPAEGDACL